MSEAVLNEEQMAAVSAPDGAALVLAGAGSGKTRVIVERMAWLAEERGVDPRNILALTFTNKAANEMRARFAARIGVERVAAWLGTFHSFGLFILRREMEALGRSKTFTIFDDGDQLSLMKKLVKDMPPEFEKVAPRDALSYISSLKQTVREPGADGEAESPAERSYRVLWVKYHEALLRASAVDFDDLLALVVRLFDLHPDVLAKYQRRYRHILVDEYQDTNHAQYRIVQALAKHHGNLFVVGDEDQSIYGWRGADISNILNFAADFPDAKVFRLERNYRSTKPILEAANAVVANNTKRLGKTLWTTTESPDRVRMHLAEDADLEAAFVVKDLVARNLAPKEVAVLYRTNAQSRPLEEALRNRGVHYIVVGGIKFYARKEIKDILAYLRLVVNPNDDESLRRVHNVPPRGIGATTMERIEEYASRRGTALLQTLRDIDTDDTFSPRARTSAQQFAALIDDLTLDAAATPIEKIVEKLLERIGYREFVEKSDEKEFRDRIEIVDEFVLSCAQYDARGGKGLLEFLQDLALLTDADDVNPDLPAVTLMTCHNAKGLEFDHVYLVGLEEGLLPLLREWEESGEDVEEERRLCYVAMTRARKTLTLTAARSRMLYGRTDSFRAISRFVTEIGKGRLEMAGMPGKKNPASALAPKPAAKADNVHTGTRVRHASFGMGTVIVVQGTGDKTRVRVRFDTGKQALLQLNLAPLEIVEGKKR